MQKKIVFLMVLVFWTTNVLWAQCIPRDSLWKRLILLRDSPAIAPPAEQLKELLTYEQTFNNCPYQFDSTHALLLQRIGVLYSKQVDYIHAIEFVKRSINIIVSNSTRPSVNYKHLIRSYFILSVFYGELNRIPEKMNAIDSCILISVKLNSADNYTLYPIWERVEYLYNIGDYQRAFEIASTAESIIKQYAHGKDSIKYIISFLNWKITALLTLKKFDLVEKILVKKIEELKKIDIKDYWGTIYEQLAEVYTKKKNFDEAYKYFQLALRYDLQAQYPLGCAQTLNNMGYILYFKGQGDFSNAINSFKKALKVLDKSKLPGGTAMESLNLLGNIASLFVEQGKYDSAFKYFQYAFDQIRPGIQEAEILQSSLIDTQYKSSRSLVSLMIEKGDTYVHRFKAMKDAGDLMKAISIYKFTDELLYKIKLRQSEIQSKLFWRADNRRLYENAIEACYLAGKTDMAFYFFEKSRAILLNDQLNEQHWLRESEILQQAQVKRKILHLEREFDTVLVSTPRHTFIEKELFTSKQELNRLISNIRKSNPLYFQSFVDSSLVSVTDVKKIILANHHALVELFAGDSAVFALIITQKQDKMIKINKLTFDTLSHLYIRYISDNLLLNKHFDEFKKISLRLYNLIFQNNILPPGRIIISPDGQYFPFEALVTDNNGKQVNYFLKDYAVSYTYSARYLMNDFVSHSSSGSRNFMGVAPVQYLPAMNLSPLPGSDESLEHLQSYFAESDNYIAGKASKSIFMEQFYKYKIIQLYTHAADSSINREPVIYFSDSSLYLSELIAEKKPFTQLIVLSACETGNGTNYQGEGVFSFNRGFAALGVPSSVTNLWSIDNVSTYRLTELFYKHLSTGLPLDVALQKAKLEYISSGDGENQLPYYWAAPILVGKTDAIILDKPFAWKYVFAGIGVAALLFFGWMKLGKKKPVTPIPGTAQTVS
jgi:CHAT domain-containing protein